MNCIFCHNQSSEPLAGISFYSCVKCNVFYYLLSNDILLVSIKYTLNNKKYNISIFPASQIFQVILDDKVICAQPLIWIFPHTVPDILSRLDELTAFL